MQTQTKLHQNEERTAPMERILREQASRPILSSADSAQLTEDELLQQIFDAMRSFEPSRNLSFEEITLKSVKKIEAAGSDDAARENGAKPRCQVFQSCPPLRPAKTDNDAKSQSLQQKDLHPLPAPTFERRLKRAARHPLRLFDLCLALALCGREA